MSLQSTPIVASARWSRRIALFSVSLLLVALALHRISSIPTPLAINLFAVGFAGAALAVLVGLVALVRIWRTGHAGAGSMAVGVLLPLMVFAGPAAYLAPHFDSPPINDVTTDLLVPPAFAALAKRPDGANTAAYPGQPFADLQARAYPDLRSLVLDRSAEEAYELVEDAVRRLRWRVVAETPPAGDPTAKVGRIEATEQTLLVGFTDDIVIRIQGGPSQARIDARSASRYGRYDFGQNAARVRRLLAEVRARAEATPTVAVAGRERTGPKAAGAARALLKRQKARDRRKAASRSGRGPAK
jgi:Protein of unknown function (DUF1499)